MFVYSPISWYVKYLREINQTCFKFYMEKHYQHKESFVWLSVFNILKTPPWYSMRRFTNTKNPKNYFQLPMQFTLVFLHEIQRWEKPIFLFKFSLYLNILYASSDNLWADCIRLLLQKLIIFNNISNGWYNNTTQIYEPFGLIYPL